MWANLTLPVEFSGAGTVIVVPARTDDRRIAVVGFHVQVDAECTLQFLDGAVDITGPVPQVAGAGFVYPPLAGGTNWQNYWWVGSVNTELNLVVVGAADGGGIILYRAIGEAG